MQKSCNLYHLGANYELINEVGYLSKGNEFLWHD